jgi:hypothetical protein
MIDTHFYYVASALVANNNNHFSPTQSQIEQISYFKNPRGDSQICMISQNFEINKEKFKYIVYVPRI